MIRTRLLFLLICGLAWGPALAKPPEFAGEVLMASGRGTATAPDGSVRPLSKGDRVYSGEILSAGPSTFVNIRFTDGGYTLLRANTRLVIEDYSFQPPAPAAAVPATPSVPAKRPTTVTAPAQGAVPKAFFRLLKGGFRAVTGLVGKMNREDYRVNTPVATIGIRGTDITVVDCDLVCQTDPVIFATLQDLPEGTSALGASILIVNSGAAYITNCRRRTEPAGDEGDDCQTVEVGAGGIVLSLTNGEQIVLARQPQFIERDPMPTPESCI